MDLVEVARWLANVDSNGCTDEEFAECMVRFYKMWKQCSNDITLTADDMWGFNTKEFGEWITTVLNEIIFNEYIDPSCWWKKEEDE